MSTRRGMRLLAGLVCAGTLAGLAVSAGPAASATAFTEYPLAANSAPQGMAAGPDGNLWFVENTASKVGYITPKGAVTEFALAQYSAPIAIAAGPDGNMWFTETNKIGRVTHAGEITLFALPSGGFPQGITAGPDGNLWFAENFRGAIGKVTPAGAFTMYSIPTRPGGASSQPIGIAAGPDGNLWFTESNAGANQVGKVTTAGAFTEYHLPTAGVTPSGIVAGPDGNLWFTEPNATNGNRVARITTSGVTTEFSLPSANASPLWLTVGPDGAVWFTESNSAASRIARVAMNGMVTEYPVPTTISSPTGIALGPDGNIWFTERAKSNLGRLHTAAAKTAYVLGLPSGFTVQKTSVPQGNKVDWVFAPGRDAAVADSATTGLFDSPKQPVGTSFAAPFTVAGTYNYENGLATAQTASIAVPLGATPTSGTTATAFTVIWATSVPAGYVVDVQVQRPGSPTFANWQTGQTGTATAFVPDAGAGTYAFRARVRNVATNAASGWSAKKAVTAS